MMCVGIYYSIHLEVRIVLWSWFSPYTFPWAVLEVKLEFEILLSQPSIQLELHGCETNHDVYMQNYMF